MFDPCRDQQYKGERIRCYQGSSGCYDCEYKLLKQEARKMEETISRLKKAVATLQCKSNNSYDTMLKQQTGEE